MNKEITKLVLPNKKINSFTISILILGFICGCIFLVMLSKEDSTNTINQITNYFLKIKQNEINTIEAFKNSLITNYIYIGLIFLLGLSIIGLIFNVFIIYIKGFITGFTLSAMILTYKIKGILSSLIYLIFGQVIGLISIILIGIYGFMFSLNLIKLIFNKKKNTDNNLFKKYIIILGCCIIIGFISSFLEVFFLPRILKLFIKLYV